MQNNTFFFFLLSLGVWQHGFSNEIYDFLPQQEEVGFKVDYLPHRWPWCAARAAASPRPSSWWADSRCRPDSGSPGGRDRATEPRRPSELAGCSCPGGSSSSLCPWKSKFPLYRCHFDKSLQTAYLWRIPRPWRKAPARAIWTAMLTRSRVTGWCLPSVR